MTKDPAVLFYTSDFLSGTSFFTMEQRGQYITLLCQQHQLGDIPENHMINICNSIDNPVIKKFIKKDNGNYFNKRMEDEAEKRKAFCLSRSNNKSGRKKKEDNEITSKSYDNHKIIHMENENDNDNIINNDISLKIVSFEKFIAWEWKDDEKFTNWLITEKEKLDTTPKIRFNANFVEAQKDKMVDDIQSKGKKYKDYKSGFRNWLRNAIKWELKS